jgi:hypothetical protein
MSGIICWPHKSMRLSRHQYEPTMSDAKALLRAVDQLQALYLAAQPALTSVLVGPIRRELEKQISNTTMLLLDPQIYNAVMNARARS